MNQISMNSSGILYQVYEPERYEQFRYPLPGTALIMNQRGMNSSGIPYQVYEPERYE
jgi:hypothetical protein